MAGASAVFLQAKRNYLGHCDSINHRFLTREPLPISRLDSFPVNGGRRSTPRLRGVPHLRGNIWYPCDREASSSRPIDSRSCYVLMGMDAEKSCPNCRAAMKLVSKTPGFLSFECPKCAFVLIEVAKEDAPPTFMRCRLRWRNIRSKTAREKGAAGRSGISPDAPYIVHHVRSRTPLLRLLRNQNQIEI